MKSGFKSKSTFNVSFKRITEKAPNQYLAEIRED